MRPALGDVVWISVDDPRPDVVCVGVIEIESVKGEQLRLREASGKISIRHVDDVFATEVLALHARCAQERFWALRYNNAARDCANNETRLRRRIAALEPARAVR